MSNEAWDAMHQALVSRTRPRAREATPDPPQPANHRLEAFPSWESLTPGIYQSLITELLGLRDEIVACGRHTITRPRTEARPPEPYKAPPTAIDPAVLWADIVSTYAEGALGEECPTRGCVYALCSDAGTVLYIGKAKIGTTRIAKHANDHTKVTAGWTRWRAWAVTGEANRQALERHLITLLKPPLNIVRPRE